ncbi:MAG: HK97 family phage prohead protease [Sphingobacterium sp.]
MTFEYKSAGPSSIKDVSVENRRVTGYGSVFDFKDSDGDIIVKGAFKKTLTEKRSRVLFLYQHDPTLILGKPDVLVEDSKGLYFEASIPDTRLGGDVIKLLEAGILTEFSIGFQGIRKERRADHTEIQEVKLWEISQVSWGANEMAQVTGMKSMTKDTMDKKFKAIVAMLKNGDMSDEGFAALEIYFAQLKQMIEEVEQPEDDSTVDQPSNDTVAEAKNLELINVINEFKNKFN